MQIELLKDIVSHISGPGSVDIVDLLYKKSNVNEFLIAKKLKLTINQTRNILYKLSDEGLVSFMRKKDQKNGGWYTYFWTLDMTKSLDLLKAKLQHELNSFGEQLESRKTKQFYYSPGADIIYSEESALEHNFICPETGEVMELIDSTDKISELQKNISDTQERIEAVDVELNILRQKEDAARERKMKAEEKKKKEERAARRKERAKEKAKLEKKLGKKKTKTAKKTKKKPAKKTKSKAKTKRTAKKSTNKKVKGKAKSRTTAKKTSKKQKKPSVKKKTVKRKTTSKKKPAKPKKKRGR